MDTTLLKGLAVLEYLIQSNTAQGVSHLAAEFELPKSNVHRTLTTLLEAGFVAQDEAGNYAPTLRTWELGVRVMSRHAVRRAAEPFMRELYQEVNETVNLVVLDGSEVIYLHQVATPKPIRACATIGERVPAILAVSGKAMLAFHADYEKRIRALYAKQKSPKPSFTQAELLAEIDTIRSNGYAKSASVWRLGVNSLASVIFSADDTPVAAIAVAGAKERFNDEKMQRATTALLNTCTNISRALGSR